MSDIVGKGGHVLFVGTKKQAQDSISEEAQRAGMFYVNHRWLGGTLTNFRTIKKNVERLKKIEKMKEDGTFDALPKKEVLGLEKEREKMEKTLGGIKDMGKLPGGAFHRRPAEREHCRAGSPEIRNSHRGYRGYQLRPR